MPLYEYECDACGGRFEVIQKFSETSEECRRCGKGPVRRLMSSPAIQFKGTGWYITDYAQKGKPGGEPAAGKSETGETKKSEKSDSATTDSSAKSESSSSTSPPSTPATTPKS
jgi:putative FmdB family regulatory protein